MNIGKKIILSFGAIALVAPCTGAKVTMPAILSSGMVVQRGHDVVLWGDADPGEEVTARCGKKKATVTAGADGRWMLALPALKPGGPYTLTVNDVKIDDVLSGDVLLCSGQSNMELPVNRVTELLGEDIASYSNPDVRQFKVNREISFDTAETNVGGVWTKAIAPDNMNFSAFGYYTARELNARTGVPVAIINSCWGGTPVEAWTGREYLDDCPLALSTLAMWDDAGYRDRVKRMEAENYGRWSATLWAMDPGLHAPVKWYAAELDDSDWTPVTLPGNHGSSRGSWGSDGLNNAVGSHWLRRTVTLDADCAGQDAMLRLGCLVDADSVYFNGEFVGSTSYQYPPRNYKVPGRLVKAGDNNITVRLVSNGGTPSFVADKPYRLIVGGDKVVPLDGEWRHRRGAVMPGAPGGQTYCYLPTVLYNKMIVPIAKYPMLGTVWYQGESNVSRRDEYAHRLDRMIDNWRELWGEPSMPFYIVELADFLHPSDRGGRAAWAEMRRAQAAAADARDNAWLIPNADLGEWNDIHPLDKKTPGTRTADKIVETLNLK